MNHKRQNFNVSRAFDYSTDINEPPQKRASQRYWKIVPANAQIEMGVDGVILPEGIV